MRTLRKFHLPGAACHAPGNLVILALYWEYTIMESPFNLKPVFVEKKDVIHSQYGETVVRNKSNQM